MITPPVPIDVAKKAPQPITLEQPTSVPVVRSKGWRRIKEIFIAEDLGTVKSKVFESVVVPSVKDFLYTLGTSTLGLIFYGENAVKAKNSFKSSFLTGSGNRISYQSYWASNLANPETVQKKLTNQTVSGYAQPLFSSFQEANDVYQALLEMMDNYPEVTVSDLYSLPEVSKNGYQNEAVFNNWGWKNLGNAHIELTPNGYTLNLPQPKHLEKI